ncbi:hypothetical protein CapIbe_015472 [Capra ibex]
MLQSCPRTENVASGSSSTERNRPGVNTDLNRMKSRSGVYKRRSWMRGVGNSERDTIQHEWYAVWKGVTKNPLCYAWHRGERVDNTQLIILYLGDTNTTTKGPAYSGRETLYPNGTLLIRNVTQRDTGPYTLLVTKKDLWIETQTGHLHVHPPVARPSLQASNATVTEHKGPVVLTCLADETGVSICWFFKGQSLLVAETMTLSSDNSTLTVDPVSREDTGDYQCEAFNRGNSNRSDPLRLHVTLQENTRALGVGAVIGIMVAVLLVLTPLAVLGCFIFLHSGRETLYPNGTLLIRNVTQRDTGPYTLLVTKKDLQTERLTGHLCIYTLLPTPVITSNNSNPRQHEDTVVLTCRFETWDVFYMCSVNNQSLPNSMELELCKGNRTLTVFNVKRHDTGPCVREAGDPENVTHDDPSTQNGLRPVARMTSESTGLQQPPWVSVFSAWVQLGHPGPILQHLLQPAARWGFITGDPH